MWRQVWRRTRGHRALAVALLLHALLSLLALVERKPLAQGSDVTAVARASEDELDVDLSEPSSTEPALPSPGAAEDGRDPVEAVPSERPARHAMAHATAKQDSQAPLDSGQAPALDAEASGAAGEAVNDSEPERSVNLGLGADGWQRWVRSSDPESAHLAPDAGSGKSGRRSRFHAPPASSTGGLQEGLEARDRELGMSPGGRVRTAVFQAAHSDIAPQLGVAVFQITVLQTGEVEVALSSASSENAGWEAVALRVADELRKKPPRIPASRKGARVLVEIKAQAEFPNGLKAAERFGPRIEARPPRLRSTAQAQSDLKERNPVTATSPEPAQGKPVNVELPGIYVAERGKVCGYRIGLSVFGPIFQGGCDLSNIGAKAQRMVHTRVREETLF